MTTLKSKRVDTDVGIRYSRVHRKNMYAMEILIECPEEYVEECIEKTLHYMQNPFGDNVKLRLDFLADYDVGDSYFEAK